MALTATWHSNAPWTYTGYGSQTKQVVRRMAADGHRMAIAANYGIEQMVTEWEGITVFPRGLDAYNNDIVGPYFDDWTSRYPGTKACQFTLFDVGVLNSPRFDDIPTGTYNIYPRAIEFFIANGTNFYKCDGTTLTSVDNSVFAQAFTGIVRSSSMVPERRSSDQTRMPTAGTSTR